MANVQPFGVAGRRNLCTGQIDFMRDLLVLIGGPETGPCAVCDEPVELRFRDRATGMKVGHCCRSAMRFAEVLIDGANKNFSAGLAHPEKISS